jgi:hypothetical protein
LCNGNAGRVNAVKSRSEKPITGFDIGMHIQKPDFEQIVCTRTGNNDA